MVLPVGGVSGVTAAAPSAATSLAPTTAPGAAAGARTGDDFGARLLDGVQQVQGLQARADQLAVQAATGDLTDAHDYTIAASQAALATELTVALRNKALEAFTEIMRMQV